MIFLYIRVMYMAYVPLQTSCRAPLKYKIEYYFGRCGASLKVEAPANHFKVLRVEITRWALGMSQIPVIVWNTNNLNSRMQ